MQGRCRKIELKEKSPARASTAEFPHTDKEGFFTIPYPLPDRIILYQRNIEDICSTEEELVEQIWKTLIHEVGHYFGLSEKDMGKYE